MDGGRVGRACGFLEPMQLPAWKRVKRRFSDDFLRILAFGSRMAYFSTTTNGNNPLLNPPGIGRNVFRGPRYFDVDMAFAKRFGLTESSNVEVRFNFFNIFNHLNLAPFNALTDNTRVNLGAFGTATQALAGRTGEFQIRFNF